MGTYNQNESAVMWTSYSKFGEGVAIQSTIRRLKESFSSNEAIIKAGKIKYKDYTRDIRFNTVT